MKSKLARLLLRGCWGVAVFGIVDMSDAHCQVFEVTAGASSLFQAQGGTLSLHSENVDASFGAGLSGGRFIAGGRVIKLASGTKTTLGEQLIPFNLPTDIFDADHYLEALGLGIQRSVHGADVTAFAGALAQENDGPFFTGSDAQRAAALVMVTKRIDSSVFLTCDVLLSKRATAIESIGWSPSKSTAAAFSAGVGSDTPYAAVSFRTSRSWFDVKAAYIAAGGNFTRSTAGTTLISEPVRENILATIEPARWFNVSGGRQRFLTPLSGTDTNVSSTVNDLSAVASVLGIQAQATFFQSVYAAHESIAEAYSANRRLSDHLQIQSSYLRAKAERQPQTTSLVTSLEEYVTPKLSFSQEVTKSAGQTSVGFGGTFLSNVASVSAAYQTYFVPANPTNPFTTALLLDVQLHAFGVASLHAASFLSPNGRTLYTADLHGAMAHDAPPTEDYGVGLAKTSIGSVMACSRVVNQKGAPIEGAAIMLDGAELFSDSSGLCCLREAHTRSHALTVLGNSFLDGAAYRVISAPSHVQSEPDERAKSDPALVVVEQGVLAVR